MNGDMLSSLPLPGPRIVEAYRDYAPPFDARKTVEMLLRHIPSEYLVGLQVIELTNPAGLSRDRRRAKTWSRNRKVRLSDCLGWYSRSTRSSGARITLLIDNIVRGISKWELRIGLFRNMSLALVLYHEVGHHIHATRRPEYRGKEDVADAWKDKLIFKLFRERYWYLYPIAQLIRFSSGLRNRVLRLVGPPKRQIAKN